MSPLQLLVVSHTHWDREWYHPAERFRQRLIPLVDELLDDPPPAGESFLLDGQGVLLEDYLAVRPERAAELGALLRDGRLEAGPWYVLADELIPSGEALVRNLLAGRATVRRLRGDPPPVLYCPDSFGHPAILPELALGFGCAVVLLWRGYGGGRWPAGDTVRWRGPSGQEVLVHHLPPDGYEFGSTLPTDPAAAESRWIRIRSVLAPRARTGTAPLLNGADHHARQRHKADALAALASAADGEAALCATSLRHAARALVEAAADAELPVVQGELRDSYGYTWTLGGTLATRAAQKRRNALVERQLVRDVEPWLALAPGGGVPASRAALGAAWRTLLRGHPHDTLCGTSTDDVAAAMDGRLRAAGVQADGLRTDAIQGLLRHDTQRARAEPDAWRPAVALRNPAPRARRGVAELRLSATIANVAVGPGSAERQGTPRRVAPWRVDGMALQLLERSERVELTEDARAYPRADRVAVARALGWVDHIAGYVVETRVQGGRPGPVPEPVQVEARALDNGLLRVEVGEDGGVRLRDRATGRTVEDVLTLEDARDVGDLYTPAIRDALPAPRLVRVRATLRGPLRGELALQYARGTSSRGVRCTIRLQLDAGLPALRVLVEGVNAERDHRLRLRIATGIAGGTTLADAAFHPVSRTPLSIGAEDARMERVVPTAPLQRWVARFDATRGATIFSDGLAEYESLDDGAVAVTLLRAVGELSRHDLPERPGHAGWPAETPAAQSPGPFAARLALALHDADTPRVRDAIERLADDVLLPISGESLRSNLEEPRATGGLELVGEGLAFSAAMPAQRDGRIVLRCVNRRDDAVVGQWRLGREIAEACSARLDETPIAPLAVRGNTVEFRAAPGEIVTVLLR